MSVFYEFYSKLIFPKVTMEAQLGLVGGTMGLLTGFSILSAVEITYFLVRFLLCCTKGRGQRKKKRFLSGIARMMGGACSPHLNFLAPVI